NAIYNNVPRSGAAKCPYLPVFQRRDAASFGWGWLVTYGIAGSARLAHRLGSYMRYAHATGATHCAQRCHDATSLHEAHCRRNAASWRGNIAYGEPRVAGDAIGLKCHIYNIVPHSGTTHVPAFG
ncbi:MAG: hypothetical protein K2J94_06320, partial [Duncaniella sp.]|nr:hypothetical protein [Duncaniella sp.]